MLFVNVPIVALLPSTLCTTFLAAFTTPQFVSPKALSIRATAMTPAVLRRPRMVPTRLVSWVIALPPGAAPRYEGTQKLSQLRIRRLLSNSVDPPFGLRRAVYVVRNGQPSPRV